MEDHHHTLKHGYGSKLVDKNMQHDENVNKLKKLEKIELVLTEKLKHTHSRQQVAYQDLEKIVHQGYGYYLKSFIERKEKHLNMFSNGKVISSGQSRNNAIN